MKILLVIPLSDYPRTHPSFLSNTDFPVGFAYIAAALKNAGHNVFGLNPNNDTRCNSAHELLKQRLTQAILESNPLMIGLGGLSTDIPFIKAAIDIIRSVRPHIQIVCGGGVISNDAGYVFNLLRPDFCIVGDGEHPIVQLADTLQRGDASFRQIPNLGFWENGVAVLNECSHNNIDINSYPFPDYEPFEIDNMLKNYSLVARYQYRYTRPHPVPMTLVAARGCPFSCSFCVHRDGKGYRSRSMQNIMEEIRVMHERYRFNILIILDELFAVNKERLKQFSTAILDGKKNYGWDFDWTFQTHASANLDYQDLTLAKEAGCFSFGYGIESASPAVLASMKKKTEPCQIENAIKLANEVKIGFGGNFIYGDPAETVETAMESFEFYKKHCIEINVNVGTIQPYPGSELFDYCLEHGIIASKQQYYEEINSAMYNMTNLSNEEFSMLLKRVNTPQLISGTCALSAREDPNSPPGERLGNGDKTPWELWSVCPYCCSAIHTRELLDSEQVAIRKVELVTSCHSCHKRFVVYVADNALST